MQMINEKIIITLYPKCNEFFEKYFRNQIYFYKSIFFNTSLVKKKKKKNESLEKINKNLLIYWDVILDI